MRQGGHFPQGEACLLYLHKIGSIIRVEGDHGSSTRHSGYEMRQGGHFPQGEACLLYLHKIGSIIRVEGDHGSSENNNRDHHHNSARIETYFAHQNTA